MKNTSFSVSGGRVALVGSVTSPIGLIGISYRTPKHLSVETLGSGGASLVSAASLRLCYGKVARASGLTSGDNVCSLATTRMVGFCYAANDIPTGCRNNFVRVSSSGIRMMCVPVNSLSAFVPLSARKATGDCVTSENTTSCSFATAVVKGKTGNVVSRKGFRSTVNGVLAGTTNTSVRPLSTGLL